LSFFRKSQEARSKKQEPRKKKQEARNKNQEPRSKRQEARTKRQEKRNKRQEARNKIPSFAAWHLCVLPAEGRLCEKKKNIRRGVRDRF
jgi:uncharacterized coiled-coil DUF342 family protein